jgi:hypothetical protein
LHHNNAPSHISFHQGLFFYEKQHGGCSPPTLLAGLASYNFSLIPSLKIKLKGRYFDTTEVIGAESQAVLNILTECDFQDTFKKWQKSWEQCTHAEGTYFEGDGGQ